MLPFIPQQFQRRQPHQLNLHKESQGTKAKIPQQRQVTDLNVLSLKFDGESQKRFQEGDNVLGDALHSEAPNGRSQAPSHSTSVDLGAKLESAKILES